MERWENQLLKSSRRISYFCEYIKLDSCTDGAADPYSLDDSGARTAERLHLDQIDGTEARIPP